MSTMPVLIRLLLVESATGFVIGCGVGLSFLRLHPHFGAMPLAEPATWLAYALVLWAFGSSFAAGYLSTAFTLFMPGGNDG